MSNSANGIRSEIFCGASVVELRASYLSAVLEQSRIRKLPVALLSVVPVRDRINSQSMKCHELGREQGH